MIVTGNKLVGSGSPRLTQLIPRISIGSPTFLGAHIVRTIGMFVPSLPSREYGNPSYLDATKIVFDFAATDPFVLSPECRFA